MITPFFSLLLRRGSLAWLGLLVGCGATVPHGTFDVRPNQDQALRIVWQTTYGRADTAPQVRWIESGELSCTDATSQKPGFPTAEGCREGLTLSPLEVRVAWSGQDRLSTTTLAHEFLHALLAREGTVDPLHQTEGFRALAACPPDHGPRCGIVDAANKALADQQL
jgi:hypothetical protein